MHIWKSVKIARQVGEYEATVRADKQRPLNLRSGSRAAVCALRGPVNWLYVRDAEGSTPSGTADIIFLRAAQQ